MIRVHCTCGERYDLKDSVAGKRVRCFTCDRLIAVPGRPAAAAPRRLPGAASVSRAAGAAAGGGVLALVLGWFAR
jgi:hypothetical protein